MINSQQLLVNVSITLLIIAIMMTVNVWCGGRLDSGWFIFMWMILTSVARGV